VAVFEITMDERIVRQEVRAWRRYRKGRCFEGAVKLVLGTFVAGLVVLGAVAGAAEVLVPTLTLLLLLILAPWLDRWWMGRQARKSSRFGYTSRIEISDAGLHETGLWNDGTVDWTAFRSARRTRKGIMLYLGQDAFKWLPFDSLVEGTREDAAEIVRRNVRGYRGR